MRQRATRILIFMVPAMAALQFAWGSDRPSRIWILPFQQLQADSSLKYLEEALPALLAVAVSGSGENHSVVERQHLNRVLAEQSLTLEGLTSTDSRHRIGRLLGATVMITGSFVPQGQQLLITMRASDLETGIISATAEGRGSTAQLGELVGSLYRRLAADLDRRLPDLTPAQIDEAPLSNLHFMKGLGHYHAARYSHALAEFVLAGEDERLTDISRFWLANAYLAQKEYAHAYLELSRLAGGGSNNVRESAVAAVAAVASMMRACEQHLSPDDVTMIRGLSARPAPAEISVSPVLVTSRPNPNESYRFFGGRTVTLPLLIRAPGPEGLTIRAELVQLTSTLAVPAGGEIDVPLSGRATGGGGTELDLAVALPVVQRETDFELRFRSSRPGARVSQAVGRIPLRVYPTDLLSPVRAWAQSHPIRVEDDGGSLSEFFAQQRIRVTADPEPRGITVFAGPSALQKQSRVPLRAGETVILLSERETDTPHFVIDRTGRGTIVRVEMRLLDRLAADPLAQKTLLAMFQHLMEEIRE